MTNKPTRPGGNRGSHRPKGTTNDELGKESAKPYSLKLYDRDFENMEMIAKAYGITKSEAIRMALLKLANSAKTKKALRDSVEQIRG